MVGLNQTWKTYVRSVLKTVQISRYEIARRGGFSASYFCHWVGTKTKPGGAVPSRGIVVAFARGSGTDPSTALLAAGYAPNVVPFFESTAGLQPELASLLEAIDKEPIDIRKRAISYLDGLVQGLREREGA